MAADGWLEITLGLAALAAFVAWEHRRGERAMMPLAMFGLARLHRADARHPADLCRAGRPVHPAPLRADRAGRLHAAPGGSGAAPVPGDRRQRLPVRGAARGPVRDRAGCCRAARASAASRLHLVRADRADGQLLGERGAGRRGAGARHGRGGRAIDHGGARRRRRSPYRHGIGASTALSPAPAA